MTGQPGRAAVLVHLVAGAARPRWCGRCCTSAGVDVTVYALTDTVEPHPVGEVSYCTRCDDPAQVAEQARRGVAEGLGVDPTP